MHTAEQGPHYTQQGLGLGHDTEGAPTSQGAPSQQILPEQTDCSAPQIPTLKPSSRWAAVWRWASGGG